jgi:hypothetical protein
VQVKELVEDNRLEGEEGDLRHGSDSECDVGLVIFWTLNMMLDL